MIRTAKNIIKTILNCYPRWKCRQEFRNQEFTRFNERPVEFNFVFKKLSAIYPRKILDVGTGTTALPHLIRNCGFLTTATDNIRDYWPSGMVNRHYYVINDDITDSHLEETFDLITCISVLEHMERADDAVRNMFRLLNQDGHLIMTFPYNERTYVRNVYDIPGSTYGQGAPYITQSYSRTEIDRWVRANQGVIMDQEYWCFWEGDYWTVGSQIIPPKMVTAADKHQLTCIHIRKVAVPDQNSTSC
ncbi:MAG: class I SAM-dependent methyltransferase [Planctomycetota bacterium]|jgi:SAM-dependent methyltransferase